MNAKREYRINVSGNSGGAHHITWINYDKDVNLRGFEVELKL